LRAQNPGKQVFLIVDSLQTLELSSNNDKNSSAVGALQYLTEYAKKHYVNIICIGQVNKSGSMAGSQKLKHMVDSMLHLYVEKKDQDFLGFRVLETLKNRFGGAGWTFFLDLKKDGFHEVARLGADS
jgi:DNA repair protein RadA/Sms